MFRLLAIVLAVAAEDAPLESVPEEDAPKFINRDPNDLGMTYFDKSLYPVKALRVEFDKNEDCDEDERAIVGDAVDIFPTGFYLPKINRDNGALTPVPVAKRDKMTIQLGAGQILPGMEQGLLHARGKDQGVCTGDKIRVYFPASLGFDDPKMKKKMREVEAGPIVPKGSALRYDIDVIEVQKLVIDKKLWDVLELTTEHHVRMNCKKEEVPEWGDIVHIKHKGWFTTQENSESGLLRQFDSSPRNGTFEFTHGARMVLPGMETVIKDLCVGSKVTIWMPPEEAFEHPIVQQKFKDWAAKPVPAWSPVKYTLEVMQIDRGAGKELFEKIKQERREKWEKEQLAERRKKAKKAAKRKAKKEAAAKSEL